MKACATRSMVVAGMMLALSLAAFAQASAQNPGSAAPAERPEASANGSALPTADQILDRYVKAIGGRAAWKKLTSRVSTGTIEVADRNLFGTIEVREKAPNLVVATITFKVGEFSQGFDGKTGWADDTQNGLREQTGAELEETKRDADFYHPLDLRDLYSQFTVTGIEAVNDQQAYAVEAVSAAGTDTMYFNVQTGLLLRIKGKHHTPDGAAEFTEDFGKYREVDGIKLPFEVRQVSADSTFTIKFTSMHHNVSIGNAVFAKPSGE